MFTSTSGHARWRKSSRSDEDSHTSNCVEVALFGRGVGLRDSKNTTGPVLTVSTTSWRFLLRAVT